MSPLALFLALTAALLHVTWNLIVKASDDRLVAAWTVSALAAVFYLPVLAVVGLPDRRVWGLVLASSVVQSVYMLLLSTAYRVGDLSFVYPIARGSAPVLVTIGGVALLSDRVGALGVGGVIVVAVALLILAVARRRRRGGWWALATGAAIATYITLDAAASRLNGSALPVVGSMFVLHSLMLGAVVLALRGPRRTVAMAVDQPGRALVAGLGSAVGYSMIMAAAVIAPVGLVSAVRETSVVFGVVAGRWLLAESVTRIHLLATFAAACGIVLIALS